MKTKRGNILERFSEAMRRTFKNHVVSEDLKPEPEQEVAKVILLSTRIRGNKNLKVLKEQTLN